MVLFTGSGRKGITPIIAIVLLLMMTVAAFGMTYFWIESTTNEMRESVGSDVTELTEKTSASFIIESVYNNSGSVSIVMRNTGRYSFPSTSGFTVYLDGKPVTATYSTTTFSIDTTTTATLSSKTWANDMKDDGKPYSFKIVSTKGAQASYTCRSSTRSSGYC